MLRDPDLTGPIYQLLAGRLRLTDFERWVYTTPTLERALPPDAYLALVSLDYRQRRAHYALHALIATRIDHKDYARWWLRGLLQDIAPLGNDLEDALVSCYDIYCHGAPFLEPLAIGYGLPLAAQDAHEVVDLSADYPVIAALARELRVQLDAGLPMLVHRLVPLELETAEPAAEHGAG